MVSMTPPSPGSPYRSDERNYDYLLKFLLVGDSDVGKSEILSSLENGEPDAPYGYSMSGKFVDFGSLRLSQSSSL